MIHLKSLLLETSNLTPAAQYCYNTILSMPEFSRSKWSIIGTLAYRNIGTTNVQSQHALGNAIDWHGKAGVGDPVMQQLADYLVANNNHFKVQYVIYNRRIWSASEGWHTYRIPKGGSPHLDHVHVDFIRGANPSGPAPGGGSIANNKLNNDLLKTAISNMEDVITRYPANWFKQYSSWNPFSSGIGDNEEAAASKFLELYEKYVLNAAINKIKNASDADKKNITELQTACNTVYQWILNDKTGTVYFGFSEWIPSTKKYVAGTRIFVWDYL